MQLLFIIGILYILSGSASAGFDAQSLEWQAAPTGHIPGKDNGVDSGESGGNEFHFIGEDCGVCHSPIGKAKDYVFTMSGTLYKDRAGREPLVAAEVILQDVEGNVISMTSNEAGNFFTTAPIASDSQAWNPALTEEQNRATSSTWRYKAWVKNDGLTTAMMTIAGVGGSSATTLRMSCGMHHAPLNSRGALLASGTPTLNSAPDKDISFRQHIMPILKNRCKSCHLPEIARPWTEYPKGTKYPYGGGLDLSAFEKDINSSRGIQDIVNTLNPDASLMLVAPMLGSRHGGGASWKDNRFADYKIIRQWIAEGAKNN